MNWDRTGSTYSKNVTDIIRTELNQTTDMNRNKSRKKITCLSFNVTEMRQIFGQAGTFTRISLALPPFRRRKCTITGSTHGNKRVIGLLFNSIRRMT